MFASRMGDGLTTLLGSFAVPHLTPQLEERMAASPSFLNPPSFREVASYSWLDGSSSPTMVVLGECSDQRSEVVCDG